MDKLRRTRVSAYTLLIRGQSILLVRCAPDVSPAQPWTLPGGGIQFGEGPAVAAVREVKEETGFDVVLRDLLAVDSRLYHEPDRDLHAIRIIYSADITGGTLTSETDGSTDAVEWVPVERTNDLPLVGLAKLGISLARQRATEGGAAAASSPSARPDR